MAEFTQPHNLAYPVASDRIKDPNVSAKLADDIKALAVTANNAIAVEGARAEQGAYDRAKWKKGLIPNGVDIREHMYGTEGQYTVLSAVETRTMTGLPQFLIDNPMGFTCVAETLQNGTALTLTAYDVWGNHKFSCTSAPSSGSNDGWTFWTKYKWDEGEDGATQGNGSSASGFKTLPLILTAGRGGNEDKAPLSATVEYDVNLAPSIYTPRFRFAIRDGNPRWGTSTAQTIQLSNISVGGVAKLSSMATNADGSITFSPWMDGKLGNLKFDYVAQQQPRYIIGGGRVNGARRTEMPFELWLEVEVPASTPAIGLVGDSNSVGVNTTIPINDAWMAIYCRRMGFFPVLYGHSGDGMSQAMTADHYKWNRWNHLDRPDMVVHANGANDIPSTEGGVTLQEMQEWARNEWAISDAKISKIKHAAVIKSRASGINNTVRLQYNNWLKSKPDPIRDWQDIASPVTASDTGGLLPQYISSDGQHMNTAGQSAIGNSPLKVMTTRSSLVFDETAGLAVKAWDYLNQREQLIYGETGIRDITALAPNVTSGKLYLYRDGNAVTLIFDVVQMSGATGTSYDMIASGGIPTGFRPTRTFWFNGIDGPPGSRRIGVSALGWVPVYLSPVPGDVYRGTITWRTTQPWPNSLPGVAA